MQLRLTCEIRAELVHEMNISTETKTMATEAAQNFANALAQQIIQYLSTSGVQAGSALVETIFKHLGDHFKAPTPPTHQDSIVLTELRSLRVLLDQNQKEITKMLSDSTKAILSAINDETNQIAAVIDALRANQSTMTEAEVNDALNSISNRLKGVAADPANPVPTTGPAASQTLKA